jgi:hypothetical protein
MAVDSVSIVSLALQAVSAKAVIILGLAMSFGLFCWALWEHTWLALAIASSFAVLVFLPLLFREGDRRASQDS